MSTYNQNSRPEPYYGGPGSRRRGQRRRSVANPQIAFRRRLVAMVMLALVVAPIAWATRDGGKPVGVAYTGGAAAVVQFDPSAGSTAPVTDDGEQPSTSPAPSPQDLVVVEDDTEETQPPATEPATTPAPPPPCSSYIVQVGDSWFGIAERSGVKAGIIAGLNGMTLQSSLLVGTEICLPAGATVPPVKTTAAPATTQAPACSGTYEVRAGDSWSRIASRYSVTVTALLGANKATKKTTLLIGQEICLPKGAKAPAQTATTTAGSSGSSQSSSTKRSYTRAELEQIVRDVWPDDLESRAFYIVNRESRWNPYVKNSWPSPEDPCCYGLFQINWTAHKAWMASHGVTSAAQLFDPVTNAKIAYAIYQRAGGWQPWWTADWRPTN